MVACVVHQRQKGVVYLVRVSARDDNRAFAEQGCFPLCRTVSESSISKCLQQYEMRDLFSHNVRQQASKELPVRRVQFLQKY